MMKNGFYPRLEPSIYHGSPREPPARGGGIGGVPLGAHEYLRLCSEFPNFPSENFFWEQKSFENAVTKCGCKCMWGAVFNAMFGLYSIFWCEIGHSPLFKIVMFWGVLFCSKTFFRNGDLGWDMTFFPGEA